MVVASEIKMSSLPRGPQKMLLSAIPGFIHIPLINSQRDVTNILAHGPGQDTTGFAWSVLLMFPYDYQGKLDHLMTTSAGSPPSFRHFDRSPG